MLFAVENEERVGPDNWGHERIRFAGPAMIGIHPENRLHVAGVGEHDHITESV
jgi:hypothetical protein